MRYTNILIKLAILTVALPLPFVALASNNPPSESHQSATGDGKKSGLLLYDRFEYKVSRDNDPKGYNTFVKKGGWTHVKAVNISGSHAGYLYTVDSIPGYKGKFPGKNSSSVLAMEARPASFETQTDFYLQYGHEKAPHDTIPGNVWFQFWIYPNNYGDQKSRYTNRFKFIYPCNTSYPCREGKLSWLYMMGSTTGEPFWAKVKKNELYMTTFDPFGTAAHYEMAEPYNMSKLGQTDLSEHLVANRWTLVKLHFDTSTSSGKYEAWVRPLGGKWTKVAEWMNGETRDFSWELPEEMVGGHRAFRMPTTVDDYDSWLYIDDFAMATSEQALPQYDR